MKRMSSFEVYLRTGRYVAEPVETKFNPWHDPEDGQFTFAGQGRYFAGRAGHSPRPTARSSQTATAGMKAPTHKNRPMSAGPTAVRGNGSPTASTDIGRPKLAPKASSLTPRGGALRSQQAPAATPPPSLRPIPGYSEGAASSWRAAIDRIVIDTAERFNAKRGLKSTDAKYVDPLLIKAWAMVESGGSSSAFLSEPLQVNNPGDWTALKSKVTGMTINQQMSPANSMQAALKWLEFKGYRRDIKGRPGPWLGFEIALQRYNGNSKLHPSGVPHAVWYANEVMKLYTEAKKSR